MTAYPLLRNHRPEGTFAWRDGNPISAARFLSDVAALANMLPAHRHVINLCADRYRFVVGLAAALCRRQVNLLPPHAAPVLLQQLTGDYPDIYCLTDESAVSPGLRVVNFPSTLGDGPPVSEIPVIVADQAACVLFTSGSTGKPTPHARSWGELVTSALAEGGRLNIAELAGATLLGTVPHQHSYGLESLVMLALQHGLALQARRLFYPADIRAQIVATPQPRMLVTTPVHLRVLLAEPETPPPVDLVLCATAPLAGQLAREAEARFAVSLYEIYGCSEAGQIAARRTALTEEWRCLDGITLRQDTAGTWASGAPIAVETLLPDVIELHDPERFLLHGRIADLVDVAGKRTSLAHLNYHLNAIDGVQDGAFAIADADADDAAERVAVGRLAAFVVAPGRSADDILAELRRRIDVAFLPRPLCLVQALPRNALGKLPYDEMHRLIAEAREGFVTDKHAAVVAEPAITGDPAATDEVVTTGGPAAVGDSAFPGGSVITGRGPTMSNGTGSPATGQAASDLADAGPVRSGGAATVHFAVGHPAAAGHFPGNPIVPGALLLRDILAAIGNPASPPDVPLEILWAKFHRPVRPGDTVEIRWSEAGDEVRFACSITSSDRPAVTGALRLPRP